MFKGPRPPALIFCNSSTFFNRPVFVIILFAECIQFWSWIKTHCKKGLAIFPARESLVSDIPAEDGKIATNFYSACA